MGNIKTTIFRTILTCAALAVQGMNVLADTSEGVQLWEGGPYWAECNVGAERPEEVGYYFQWGDTAGYRRNGDQWILVENGSTFEFTTTDCLTYSKSDSQLLDEGYIDGTGNLTAENDAATTHLGAPWRMPTDVEISDLIANCDKESTERNGIKGYLFIGRGAYASKSIFLPAAGLGCSTFAVCASTDGLYWSSTPVSDNPYTANYLNFYDDSSLLNHGARYHGQLVRAVRDCEQRKIPVRVSVLRGDGCEGVSDITAKLYAGVTAEPQATYDIGSSNIVTEVESRDDYRLTVDADTGYTTTIEKYGFANLGSMRTSSNVMTRSGWAQFGGVTSLSEILTVDGWRKLGPLPINSTYVITDTDAEGIVFMVSVEKAGGLYCVIDLSGGVNTSSYSVSYLNAIPAGGWTDEYKTTKLVMRRINAGDDPLGRYSLTKDFYIGVFEITQRQWELVMGNRPSWFNNDDYYALRPVEQVAYDDIRGRNLGSQWPESNDVDVDSFVGILRNKTGINIDLPTEAQWEYACRSGTTTDYNNGTTYKNAESEDSYMNVVGRYFFNGGSSYEQAVDTSGATAKVGSYQPNAWGLYDMHGNVWEWCLDWGGVDLSGTDPLGAASAVGQKRCLRGGSWGSYAYGCVSSIRYDRSPSKEGDYYGLRLVSNNASEQSSNDDGVQLWEDGPYWAECNIGATRPEEYGYYFWWGDTVGYIYDGSAWNSVDGLIKGFSFATEDCSTYVKSNAQLLDEGYLDTKGNLAPEYDAATVYMKGSWRLPTDSEFRALIDNCDTEWTIRNGIHGQLIKGRGAYASKSIFFPASGKCEDTEIEYLGSYGYCWSSTPCLNDNHTWYFGFNSSRFVVYDALRSRGWAVRAVRDPVIDTTPQSFPEGSISVESYSGVYDGAEHGVTVSVRGIEEVTIEYSLDGYTYSGTAPVFKDVNMPEDVYVRFSADGYETKVLQAIAYVTWRGVTLTSGSATKSYDGTPLVCHEVTIGGEGFVDGEGIDIVYTGSQTDIGTSKNTFTYTAKSGTKLSNYTIGYLDPEAEIVYGDLTVTEPNKDQPWVVGGVTNYYLNVSAEQGTVTGATNGWYKAGSKVALRAKADAGYHFLAWEGDLERTYSPNRNEVLLVWMDRPRKITAKFEAEASELGGVQLWEGGPYWAECNVGAEKPEYYGYYFWWGDTVGYTPDGGTWTSGYYYSGVTWVSSSGERMSASPFSSSSCPTWNKTNSDLQSLGYIDSTGNLVAKYDAATAHLGASWRMPTAAEFAALLNNCDTEWTTRNGVNGRLVKGRDAYASKSIFLPAAGEGYGSNLYGPGSYGGYYWSSTPDSGNAGNAWHLSFDSGGIGRSSGNRYYVQPVRPVRGFAQ